MVVLHPEICFQQKLHIMYTHSGFFTKVTGCFSMTGLYWFKKLTKLF